MKRKTAVWATKAPSTSSPLRLGTVFPLCLYVFPALKSIKLYKIDSIHSILIKKTGKKISSLKNVIKRHVSKSLTTGLLDLMVCLYLTLLETAKLFRSDCTILHCHQQCFSFHCSATSSAFGIIIRL